MATVYTLVQPLVAGTAYTFYAVVGSQSDTDVFQTSVTLATGDVTLSKDDGGFSNLGTLPTEIGTSGVLKVTLSSGETTGVTNWAIVRFNDASGGEWQDTVYMIPTSQAVTVSSGTGVTLSAAGIQAIFDATLTEGYAADGAAMTLAQALYEAVQFNNEKAISDGTVTIKKRDGSTSAYTLTLTATSVTRAS